MGTTMARIANVLLIQLRCIYKLTFVNDAKFGLRLRMAVPEICLVLAPTKYSFCYKGREKAEVDADDV